MPDESKLNKEFLLQNEEIERQKKEIVQSIEYASLIQAALLPPSNLVKKVFKNHFIIYIPRDIVSGDFYWISTKEEWVYFAAADCTGHGVPGALMSILGISFLNEILSQKALLMANRVLNLLREKIMKSLHQTGEISVSKDGMDISLCVFNPETLELHFAGANNPLYYFRDNKLNIIKGDRMPIGISGKEEQSFTDNLIKLRKGDMLYIFSDGYADQFGGPDWKKLKYSRFREILEENHKKPIIEQNESLLNAFFDWKGEHDQIDDILLMGIKI